MHFRKSVDTQAITPPPNQPQASTSAESNKNEEPLWRRLVDAAGITLVAYVLSLFLTQPFSFSARLILSSADKNDFSITDFYNVVANSRPVSDCDTSIVIVDIAFTDRNDVTDIIELLADLNPKAVGVDVTFNEKKEGDERLLAALERCPNLVMAVGVSPVDQRPHKKFVPDDYSYFYNHDCKGKHTHGVINLPTRFAGSTIRKFKLKYPINHSKEEISAFSLALAEVAAPEAARKAMRRGNDMETIDFPSREFEIIPWYELPENTDKIDGKIVLVGAIGELGDTHATPIDPRMAGVVVHAHALSTILRDHYYWVAPKWLTMTLSFLLCFLLCLGNVSMRKNGARAMWMRVVQLVGLYFIARIGYWLYIDHSVIVDFSYTLMMLLFGFFAVDIWFGIKYYVEPRLSKKK